MPPGASWNWHNGSIVQPLGFRYIYVAQVQDSLLAWQCTVRQLSIFIEMDHMQGLAPCQCDIDRTLLSLLWHV